MNRPVSWILGGVRSLSLGFWVLLESTQFCSVFFSPWCAWRPLAVAKADKPDLAAKWLRKASDLRLHAQADPQWSSKVLKWSNTTHPKNWGRQHPNILYYNIYYIIYIYILYIIIYIYIICIYILYLQDSADVWDFRRGFWWLLTQLYKTDRRAPREVPSIRFQELKILKAFRSGF